MSILPSGVMVNCQSLGTWVRELKAVVLQLGNEYRDK